MVSFIRKWFTLFSVFPCLFGVAAARETSAQQLVEPQSSLWRKQSPFPTGRTLNGVDMISPTEAWAVGEAGTIVHTTDGGSTWTIQNSGTSEPLNAVHFKDALHGWAVGNIPLYTTDGGRTWNAGTGIPGTVYNVEFADLNTGFATRGLNYLYKTSDGGRNWSFVQMPFNINRIQFFDSLNGIASGDGGVLRSTDGGRTWNIWATTHGGYFINFNEGWFLTENRAERTTDGGRTWQSQTVPPEAQTSTYTYKFLDSQHGWAAGPDRSGDGLEILKTDDGGATWVTQRSESIDSGPFWGIDFADAANGIAVGNCAIYNTADGGSTWTRRLNGRCSETLGMAATDSQHVWAANEGLHSTDGGVTWQRANFNGGTGVDYSAGGRDVDFVDNLNGWIVGNGYTDHVFRSTDGGRTYRPQPTGIVASLEAVDAVDAQTIFAVGNATLPISGPVVLRSRDGGATWVDLIHPYRDYSRYALYGVHFVNSTTGWAVGSAGGVIKTTDGGETWINQQTPAVGPLTDVAFADTLNGWVVGYDGAIFRTRDGGESWEQQNVGTTGPIGAISAVSPSIAWVGAYGSPGFVARTLDGGSTWTREIPDANPNGLTDNRASSYSAVLFLDGENGWAGGYSGIYRRVATAAINQAPVVNLTSPAANSTFTAPANITITATASDTDGALSKVEFYAGAILLGTDTAAPYSFAWNNVSPGGYSLTAVATDDTGLATTSSSVAITVSAPATAPSLNSVTLNPSSVTAGGSVQGTITLSAPAPSGGVTVALSSSNANVATAGTSITIPAGATSTMFGVATSPVAPQTTVTISASYGGVLKTATLTVSPAETVAIKRAEYSRSNKRLRVEATSNKATATLRVFQTSTGELIGTLSTNGGGKYSGQFSWPTNPQNITVSSSLGGSASASVAQK